jgi:crotonobetainyl-CoA:carnitine CoA-transferase CaiB-like acyl-CoA transferase
MGNDVLPLSGIRVIELGHAVMGPVCAMVLADMGAEVIKIERAPKGDMTRNLLGFGLGLFPFFNRNKKSLVLDLKSEEGRRVLKKLIKSADVMLENFAPGAVDRLGFDYESCAALNPRLIYCNLKGFMPGPYDKRPSLDNLVQMMGGLAYMTGPKGRPLRAGASVIDIMGGSYGAMGIITALYEREKTGKGQKVLATLYEAAAFTVGQHMAVAAVTGQESTPMPEGTDPWAVYDLFDTGDGEKIFIGLTSDRHWDRFCETFGFNELLSDPEYADNNLRVENRPRLISQLQGLLSGMELSQIAELCEKAVVPFAPITRPDQLSEDVHLNQAGCLAETRFPDGTRAKLPKLPLRMGEYDFRLRQDPPTVGRGGKEVLLGLGFSQEDIERMAAEQVAVFQKE